LIQIAEILSTNPSPLWKLVKQAGVKYVVAGLPYGEPTNGTDAPWDYAPLARMKKAIDEAGFILNTIESRPPLQKAKRGLPGRDEEIATVCTLIENMGKLGIPVWCYEWMTEITVVRTSIDTLQRGGSRVTSFNNALLENAPPLPGGPFSEEQVWETLQYFLSKVLPVAEKWNVKLAMHPDDPPFSPLRGIGRIMSTVEGYQRLVDMAPSPMNGICLCQGNFTLMTKDLPGVIRHFGKQNKIFFVHYRDVVGTPDHFDETWHDNGQTDMLACMQAYKDVGFDGVLRPDHYPNIDGDPPNVADSPFFSRLYALGYIRGLQQAVYASDEVTA